MQAAIERTLVVKSSPPVRAPIVRRVLRPLRDHAFIRAAGDGEQALESARALVIPHTGQPTKQIERSDAKG